MDIIYWVQLSKVDEILCIHESASLAPFIVKVKVIILKQTWEKPGAALQTALQLII